LSVPILTGVRKKTNKAPGIQPKTKGGGRDVPLPKKKNGSRSGPMKGTHEKGFKPKKDEKGDVGGS